MKRDARIKLINEISVSGAKLTGNVVVVTGDTVSYSEGDWIGGVDNTDGYVIIGDTQSSNLIGRSTGGGTGVVTNMTPTFWKSTGLTDEDLIALINKIPGSPGDLSSVVSARAWLDSQNGFVISNDYGGNQGGGYNLGDYMLSTQYAPSPLDGFIIFPAHPIGGGQGQSVTNPNLVGTNDGEYAYQFYINSRDTSGTDWSTNLDQLIGNSGTITLTQGSDSVTYSFTDQAFKSGYPDLVGNEPVYFYDSQFNNGGGTSPLGSLAVTSPSNDHFNIVDPVTILITIN